MTTKAKTPTKETTKAAAAKPATKPTPAAPVIPETPEARAILKIIDTLKKKPNSAVNAEAISYLKVALEKLVQ